MKNDRIEKSYLPILSILGKVLPHCQLCTFFRPQVGPELTNFDFFGIVGLEIEAINHYPIVNFPGFFKMENRV